MDMLIYYLVPTYLLLNYLYIYTIIVMVDVCLFCSYVTNIRKLFSTLIIMDYLHGITSVTFALFQSTVCTINYYNILLY